MLNIFITNSNKVEINTEVEASIVNHDHFNHSLGSCDADMDGIYIFFS